MVEDPTQTRSGKAAGGTKFGAGFEDFGRKVEGRFQEALPRVEEEVRKVIAYLNDEVVPQVRQNSSVALKAAAEHLSKLAEHLDSKRGGGTGQP